MPSSAAKKRSCMLSASTSNRTSAVWAINECFLISLLLFVFLHFVSSAMMISTLSYFCRFYMDGLFCGIILPMIDSVIF